MSNANVPPRPDASPDIDPPARAGQASAQPPFQPSIVDWEAVPLPGMLPVESVPMASEDTVQTLDPRQPESGLKTQIQDLKRCNEALLARVNQLEESLEKAHQALQQEAERSQHRSNAEKMTIAQQHSVAQLLSELEESDAALKRQTVLAETLQAQLETYQERSRQLEKECTVLRKQQAEKTQDLQEAEATCRDLRSRLQRQQRYTLQFKVALEKSLDTSAFNHPPAAMPATGFDDVPVLETTATPNPLAMPRSERIRPWSATEAGGQTDPQLLSLVRSLNEPTPSLPISTTSLSLAKETSVASEATIVDQEAEKQLWQDVERVIENSTSEAEAPKASDTPQEAASADEVQFTEPMPWGTPIPKEPEAAAATSETEPAKTTVEAIAAAAVLQNLQTAADETRRADKPTDKQTPQSSTASSWKTEIPALDAVQNTQASPSPIVHPLRPPTRKRKSLSAVELPNFPPLPKKKS
ncbi:MAG: hypothetical protein ACFBSF_08380 [Leptolyngbyaceae cyanobacterium]